MTNSFLRICGHRLWRGLERLTSNYRSLRLREPRQLRLCEKLPLGEHFLAVIDCGGQLYLLAVSRERVSILTSLSEARPRATIRPDAEESIPLWEFDGERNLRRAG